MEEYIGNLWHQAVTRWADTAHHPHAVRLDDMQKPIGILFRANHPPLVRHVRGVGS